MMEFTQICDKGVPYEVYLFKELSQTRHMQYLFTYVPLYNKFVLGYYAATHRASIIYLVKEEEFWNYFESVQGDVE